MKNDRHRIIEVETAEQIAVVTGIINRSFQTVADEFLFTKETVPGFPAYISIEKISGQIRDGLNMYLYEEGDRNVGCIGICFSDGANGCKVERLAVIPEFRHRGIGKKLMEFIENKAKLMNEETLQLEIVHENSILKNWYSANGFVELRIDTYDHLPFKVGVLEKKLR